MKGLNISTILLGLVLVSLLISVGLIAFTMFKMSRAVEYVMDPNDAAKVTTEGVSAKKFWTSNKAMLAIPTVSNVISMILIGVLVVMR